MKCTNNTAELWTNFIEKTKQPANQMRPPKNNHRIQERGKRKQEFIELKKQQETKNAQVQKLKVKIRLNKMDAIVKKAIAEDKDSWIQQNTDEIRMAACEGNKRRVFEVVCKLTLKRKVWKKSPSKKKSPLRHSIKTCSKKVLKKPRAE